MKIVIIGAGIAGLSTYLFLKKHLQSSRSGEQHEIKIYESHDIYKVTTKKTSQSSQNDANEPVFTPEAIGSAIGISKNGVSVIRRLDTNGKMLPKVMERSHPIYTWQMTNARGWHLHNMSTGVMEDRTENEQKNSQGRIYDSILISRQGFWEVLRDTVLEQDGSVVQHKKVTEIIIGDNERQSVVKFADGTEETQVDLVIGADGSRSVLRRYMFPTGQNSQKAGHLSNKSNSDYITPRYEGLVGFGKFIPSSILKEAGHPPGTMSIVFGPNGFFGYGYVTSAKSKGENSEAQQQVEPGPTAVFWSTFPSPVEKPFPVSSATTDPYVFDKEAGLEDLLKRHQNWKNPTLHRILDYIKEEGLDGFYPTWTTPELPDWQQNGRVVLVGDAAHALQPSSGQGACQALEDAESLALLLEHYLSEVKSSDGNAVFAATQTSLTKFVQLRKPRLHKIYVQSQRMAGMKKEMGFVQEMVTYGFIKLMPYLMPKDANEQLFNYDVPAEVEKIVKT